MLVCQWMEFSLPCSWEESVVVKVVEQLCSDGWSKRTEKSMTQDLSSG